MSISDDETLNLRFDSYRTAQSGAQELYYFIECRDATILELSPNYPHSVNHAEAQPEKLVLLNLKTLFTVTI
ncbi:hypothetical protein Xmir_00950 [Xenorhabdus miraniensis]|uniref:Uncharacterized protein n=2 Tax=Xenorhabdus miraniensis TaxID=351674 RepID=A0A2D0JUR9_9GAMM|nr:hypothetical protein Xmir_00950 [Xenorhabdus miraniensis]